MEGCPVVIRFLDPPLHEFLPTKEEDIKEIAGRDRRHRRAPARGYRLLHEF